jgi:hypothetical protein
MLPFGLSVTAIGIAGGDFRNWLFFINIGPVRAVADIEKATRNINNGRAVIIVS